jgi:transcription elongation factor GreA
MFRPKRDRISASRTYESEPEKGKISVSSPIGQALVGSKVGDEIRVRTPKGIQEFEILGIY